MAMKSTHLAVLIVPVIGALLMLPGVPTSQPDPPRTREQAAMGQLFRDLSTVFRLTLNEDEFEDPANRDRILTSLNSLSGNADQMATHAESGNPSTDYFVRSLVRDAHEAVMHFRQGQYQGSRFLIDQLVNNCFACHSRLPSDTPFQLGEQFLKDTAVASLAEEDLARLQVTMRQFDAALDTYEMLFASRKIPAATIATSAVFENYLRVCLRVEDDCERAIETFNRFRGRPDVPDYLDKRLAGWVDDLKALNKKREDRELDPLGHGRELIRDAQYNNAYPNDPQGAVRFVAATGCLHRYLQSSPSEVHRMAEAYYLLGVAESYICPSYWRSHTDVLLECAIRVSPRSVYGRMALQFLEEYTVSGYTGSSGVSVPSETQERLDELRSLVEGDNQE